MTIRAVADKKYLRRYLLLSLAGLGICLWAVYDSFYKFPKELEMAIAFDQHRQDPHRGTRWRELYQQNKDRGWTEEMPKNSSDVVRGYIQFNKGVMIFGIGLMSWFLFKYFHTRGSWMESTETGIITSRGYSFEFEKISKINKRKWEDKGIAKVYFEDADGRRSQMTFDDYKYERGPMADLMTRCEKGLSRDQIVGGKSQAEIAAAIAEAESQREDASGESDNSAGPD